MLQLKESRTRGTSNEGCTRFSTSDGTSKNALFQLSAFHRHLFVNISRLTDYLFHLTTFQTKKFFTSSEIVRSIFNLINIYSIIKTIQKLFCVNTSFNKSSALVTDLTPIIWNRNFMVHNHGRLSMIVKCN